MAIEDEIFDFYDNQNRGFGALDERPWKPPRTRGEGNRHAGGVKDAKRRKGPMLQSLQPDRPLAPVRNEENSGTGNTKLPQKYSENEILNSVEDTSYIPEFCLLASASGSRRSRDHEQRNVSEVSGVSCLKFSSVSAEGEVVYNEKTKVQMPSASNSSSRTTHGSVIRIPGPAGELCRRRDGKESSDVLRNEPQLQDYQNLKQVDEQFEGGPWKAAMDVLDAKQISGVWAVSWTTIGFILAEKRGGRVDQIVAMVSSLQQTDFGDARIELKDHTGTLNAMIPGRVFSDEDVSEKLTVGSVLILKSPVVFSPQPGRQYLNIRERNIVHIFPAPPVNSPPAAIQELGDCRETAAEQEPVCREVAMREEEEGEEEENDEAFGDPMSKFCLL